MYEADRLNIPIDLYYNKILVEVDKDKAIDSLLSGYVPFNKIWIVNENNMFPDSGLQMKQFYLERYQNNYIILLNEVLNSPNSLLKIMINVTANNTHSIDIDIVEIDGIIGKTKVKNISDIDIISVKKTVFICFMEAIYVFYFIIDVCAFKPPIIKSSKKYYGSHNISNIAPLKNHIKYIHTRRCIYDKKENDNPSDNSLRIYELEQWNVRGFWKRSKKGKLIWIKPQIYHRDKRKLKEDYSKSEIKDIKFIVEKEVGEV